MSVAEVRPRAIAAPHPFFLEVRGHRIFAVHHRPSDGLPVRGHVLCAPPFNEEMNRCRSMITLQACRLAEQGIGVLVVDLLGTGDSEGDFVDARWDAWLDDLRAGLAWLDDQPGGCRALWGIRLGAILANELLHERAPADATALLLWQPVVDGRQHLSQFMRVRIAAQLDRKELAKETTASMRERWSAGGTVEIAGYEIHCDLAAALERARLDRVAPRPGTAVHWLEQASPAGPGVSEASRRVLEQWRAAGVDPDARTFEGPAFWQQHERVVASEALAATAEWAERRL